MRRTRARILQGAAAFAMASLALTGCAGRSAPSAVTTSPPDDAVVAVADCGWGGVLDYDLSPGEESRARAIEAMIERWRKVVGEGVETVLGSPQEFQDGIDTFELALEALPAAERDAASPELVEVEAVTAEGEDWGTVRISAHPSGGYVIDSFGVNHEAGKICPTVG